MAAVNHPVQPVHVVPSPWNSTVTEQFFGWIILQILNCQQCSANNAVVARPPGSGSSLRRKNGTEESDTWSYVVGYDWWVTVVEVVFLYNCTRIVDNI